MATATEAEIRWYRKLQKVLNECPSDRMAAYTIGDAGITLYDTAKDQEIVDLMNSSNADFCDGVAAYDARLADIDFPFPVHSTAG